MITEFIRDDVTKAEQAHREACVWTHGDAVDVWRDENGVLCVRYADGKWWHYKETPDGIEWW